MSETIPVYWINGFLESGKTEFIQFTLAQDYFSIDGTTLLILCEEGIVEYEEDLLEDSHTVVEVIDEESDFNPDNLSALTDKYRPERIIVEFNGMWLTKNVTLPPDWEVEQQITHVDASTFDVYYKNMKSLFGEMVKRSDMVIFNRCDDVEDLAPMKRTVQAVNGKAEIIFEDAGGEVEEFTESDLPFDLEAPVIDLEDFAYGIFYLDAMDNPERYEGKQVRFKGLVLKPENFPEGCFVPGRMAMTCCEDDMAFLGYVCKSAKADRLHNQDWVEVTAKIAVEYWQDYEGKGPVLYASNVRRVDPPANNGIISFM